MQQLPLHLLLASPALMLFAGVLVSPLRSAQAPQADSPAVALEKQANAAVAKLGAVSYRARTWTSGGATSETGTVDVVAGSAHGIAGLPLSRPLVVHWLPKKEGEPAVLASFDGKRLLHQMPEEKTVWDLSFKPEGGIPMIPIFDVTLPGLGQPKIIPMNDVPRSLGKPIEVSGHACDLIVATRKQEPSPDPDTGKSTSMQMRMEVAVDASSHLPLRGEFIVSSECEGKTTETFRHGIEIVGDLHPLAAEPRDFSVPVPEGWKLVDANPKEDAPRLSVGEVVPDWTLSDYQGREHKLSQLRGRVVLLDFWATWCGPCKQAMPELQKLHERFESRGLTVVGISQHENAKGDPAGYFQKMKYTYLGLVKGEQPAEAYGVSGIPHLFLIDREGKLVEQHVGFEEGLGERLAARIETLLAR